MKTCPRCGSKGPFGRNRTKKNGLSTYCKTCLAALYKRNYYRRKERGPVTNENKICPQCGSSGPFYVDLGNKDGLSNHCKECRSKTDKQYRDRNVSIHRNPEPVDKVCPKCGSNGPFAIKRGTKNGWESICKECKSKRQKGYYQLRKDKEFIVDPEKVCIRCGGSGPFNSNCTARDGLKQYCKECEQESNAAWMIANAAYYADYKRAYRLKHPEGDRQRHKNRRALKKQVKGKHTDQDWMNLKVKYDFTCVCCLRREPEIELTEDHVVPLSMPGSTNTIDNIQPLCKSCNSRKNNKHIDYRPAWEQSHTPQPIPSYWTYPESYQTYHQLASLSL